MAKDHINSKFYLKGFARKKPGRSTVIEVHDRQEGTWSTQRPADVDVFPDYYDIQDASGNASNLVDKFIKPIEARAGSVFSKLRNREELDAADRRVLAAFVGLSFLRRPQLHDEVERSIQSEAGALSGRARDVALVDSISEMRNLAERIADFSWVFLTCPDGDCFITSDAPLIQREFAWRGRFFSRTLTDLGAEFVMPLTSSVALAGLPEGADRGFKDVSSKVAAEVNIDIWVHATRCRFAPRRSFTGASVLPDSGQ